jgi:glucokinase
MTQDSSIWIGFDLGGTKMLAQVLDDGLRPLGKKRRKTKGYEGVNSGLERIVKTIEEALVEGQIEPRRVAGIGIACPGPIHRKKGVLLEAPNLGWKDVALRQYLEKKFNCPVVLANDVDAGVYGETTFGAGRKEGSVLGVFPGTGIGGGFVYEGRILQSRTGTCMELGHIPVMSQGPRCGCGQRGCLEAIASRLAISAAAAAAAYRGQAPNLLEKAGADLTNIRSNILAASIAAGDKEVEMIVRDAARWLGVGVAGCVNLLAPDCIVLGGGLVEALPALYLQEFEKSVRGSVMKAFQNTFSIKIAELGDDATALGAGAWARSEITSAKPMITP